MRNVGFDSGDCAAPSVRNNVDEQLCGRLLLTLRRREDQTGFTEFVKGFVGCYENYSSGCRNADD